ncbi:MULTISPECIES: FAD-dependent oxidoreductase [unclassified Chelatococcus]|uniref:FAD-dependent oxidoreductase n=1 Tax=unclassified Chelatococcus TaxID=2638111 RepID=UPI001BCE905C|nr:MULTISPECIES: FAD-dependent oxidoreductase [unclassified Chelatococcus]MBS7700620.1 FAD-dependent oxidoreductase [Chelatococcus sp. YT9]MBX3559051.1 FAD-dependent oxidoreductase [Chelatococcus sp.]
MIPKHEYDVVVVGHGIAGMSAAVSAAEQGARVCVLERAPEEESGGCTRNTEAYMRLKNENELSDDFEEEMAAVASANPDPHMISEMAGPEGQWPSVIRAMNVTDPSYLDTFASRAVPTIQWLKSMGVRFLETNLPQITLRNQPMIAPSGGGHALLVALLEKAREAGVTFHYETTATGLIQDDAGAVVGVKAVMRQNRRVDFRAKAVVLASGGFEGSPEMLARYIGPGSINIRPVARGAHYNRGEGIRMALEIGAAPAGDYGSYHSTPVDLRSGRQEAKVLIFAYGVVVNKYGQRFADEGQGADYTNFDRICWAIQKQPDGVGYAIYDSSIEDVPNYKNAIYSDLPPVKANTIGELAAKLGIPVKQVEETIATYNAACPQIVGFDPSVADGLSTKGLVPPKSNWSRPIGKAPFFAYPLIPSGIITFGGIKTDAEGQVLNADGDRIPGLLAAGALVGVYHRRYPAATSVLRGATFGRIAGTNAARVRHNEPVTAD